MIRISPPLQRPTVLFGDIVEQAHTRSECPPRLMRILSFWMVLICGLHEPVFGQGKDGTCHTCSLDMVRIQVIPGANAAVVIQNTPTIVYAKGAYVLAPTYGGAAAVFRNNSLEPVGKRGRGPGEFPDRPITMGSSSDGNVFAVVGNVVNIIDPKEMKVLHGFTLPGIPAVFSQVGKESLVVDAGSTEVNVVDRNGIVRKNPTEIKLKMGDILRLAPSGDTAYWVGSQYTYTAYLTRLDGTVIRTLRRAPDWFKSSGAVPGEPLQAPPSPSVRGFIEIGDGLLLVVLSVADSQWKPGPRKGMLLSQMRPDDYVDTVLEIVDPGNSHVITSSRYDQAIHLVHGSKYVWLLKEDDAGEEAFEIFQPRLRR